MKQNPQFERVEFPAEAAKQIKAMGGEPVMAMVYAHRGRVIGVIVSNDPSGPNGELEAHASVSVSYFGQRMLPTKTETLGAILAIGWQNQPWHAIRGNGCVHLYQRGQLPPNSDTAAPAGTLAPHGHTIRPANPS